MKRILIVGDYIDDVYRWCKVPRLCPEAPAPVLIVEREETRPGGCGNVAENVISISGKKEQAIMQATSHSRKYRYFCGNHLLFRVDEDSKTVLTDLDMVTKSIEDAVSDASVGAIIISDYDKGGVSHNLARFIINSTSIPVFIDAKCHDPNEKYDRAFCIFPNEHEHPTLDPKKFKHIVRKLGPQGCMIDQVMIPTVEQPVFDVTGAGDVFIAAFVLEYLNMISSVPALGEKSALEIAAQFANTAAGISVRHVGTYAVTLSDLGWK